MGIDRFATEGGPLHLDRTLLDCESCSRRFWGRGARLPSNLRTACAVESSPRSVRNAEFWETWDGGEQLEVSVERDLAMRTSSGLSSEGSAQSKNAIIVGVRRRAPAAAVSSDEGGARCDREETYVAA